MPKVTGQYKSDLREKIIQAAIESFAQTGFDKTKMEDIAKRLGLIDNKTCSIDDERSGIRFVVPRALRSGDGKTAA